MGMWTKVVAGSPAVKSRLHDQYGQRVSLSRIIRNSPRAFVSTVARIAYGYRPPVPWISYDAQVRLARFLGPDSRVLEFGSGMSTRWYADHAGEVVSIEDYRPWYDKVAAMLKSAPRQNIRYRFAETPEQYVTLTPQERGDGFDLIMIDGSWRDRCVDTAIAVARPGAIIYLDNADKKEDIVPTGNVILAREKLLQFADQNDLPIEWITDFAPTSCFSQTALLVRL